ncbi:DUF2283 domain-containing protein [Desulfurobacterium sp.]
MQIRYSPEVDILVIKLSDKPVYESEHLAEQGIVIDYDENNEVVGLEIFGWSKRENVELPIVGKFFKTKIA